MDAWLRRMFIVSLTVVLLCVSCRPSIESPDAARSTTASSVVPSVMPTVYMPTSTVVVVEEAEAEPSVVPVPKPTATSPPAPPPVPEATPEPEPTVTSVPQPSSAPQSSKASYQPDLCVIEIESPDTLNVRSGPSIDAPVVAEIRADYCGVEQLGSVVDGWAPAQFHASGSLQTGYVWASYLSPGPEHSTYPGLNINLVDRPWCFSEIATTNESISLHIAPNSDALVIGHVPVRDCTIYPTGETVGDWHKVSVDSISRGGWLRHRIESTERFASFDPATPMTTRTFVFEWVTSGEPPSLENFRVIMYVPDRVVLGKLDESGSIRIPTSIDPSTLRMSGHGGDKYCLINGVAQPAVDGVYPVVLTPGICV